VIWILRRGTTADLRLSAGPRRREGTVCVPETVESLDDVLPAARDLSDLLADHVTDAAERAGTPVSCTKGCGACCRQLVPLLPVEARHLSAVVDDLPEHRRAVVRGRARAVVEALDGAGLLASVRQVGELDSRERRELGASYFELGLSCPFLEDEACSIHADRPLKCRDYLVINDPMHCREPLGGGVVGVALRGHSWAALRELASVFGADEKRVVPLVLAVAEAESWHPAPKAADATAPGQDVLARLLAATVEADRTEHVDEQSGANNHQ
jgi:Fe-S-cluster containining protein